MKCIRIEKSPISRTRSSWTNFAFNDPGIENDITDPERSSNKILLPKPFDVTESADTAGGVNQNPKSVDYDAGDNYATSPVHMFIQEDNLEPTQMKKFICRNINSRKNSSMI